MKYKTFRLLALAALAALLGFGGWGVKALIDRPSEISTAQPAAADRSPVPAPPVTPLPVPEAPVPAPPPPAAVERPSVSEIRADVERWLAANGDRQGRDRLDDVLPATGIRITAVRFPEESAVRWSDHPSQWSQIRMDFNRDNVADEKWLLKNGHTWKREPLGPDGRTALSAEYFN